MRIKVLNTTRALRKSIDNKKLSAAFYKAQGVTI